MELHPVMWLYQIMQWLLDKLLSPNAPPPNAVLSRPRIAIIGAGLTGVSAASHCVGHGFDVRIFEAGDNDNLGGIWSVGRFQSHIHRVSTDQVSASKQYKRSSDPFHHVSLPSFCQMGQRLP